MKWVIECICLVEGCSRKIKSSHQHLKIHDMTVQQYLDYCKFNFPDIEVEISHPSIKNTGKTYEEISGVEKAKERKIKLKVKKIFKNGINLKKDVPRTKEVKEKIGKKIKQQYADGYVNPMKGKVNLGAKKPRSLETKKKMSDSSLKGDNSPNKTPERRKKISDSVIQNYKEHPELKIELSIKQKLLWIYLSDEEKRRKIWLLQKK